MITNVRNQNTSKNWQLIADKLGLVRMLLLDIRGSPNTGLLGLSSLANLTASFLYFFPMMEVQMMVRVVGSLGEDSLRTK